MHLSIESIKSWIEQPDFKSSSKNQSAFYIQAVSLTIIFVAVVMTVTYVVFWQPAYILLITLNILVFSIIIILIRLNKLELASNLFLGSTLGLLTLGVWYGGGIHASSSVLYPIIIIFASLLLNRKSYIVYSALCIASVGLIVIAERYHLAPPYTPDPPELPLFISVSLLIASAALFIRFITEGMQNNLARAQEAMQDIAAQKTMLDYVGQAVVGCQADNKIIYWNQAAANLYGWKIDEVLGKKYYDVIPTSLTSENTEAIRTIIQKGEIWSGEMIIQKRDQKSIPVLVTVAPLYNRDNMMTGWIGVAANLTEREKVEASLRERESILEAVTFAAEQFIKISDWRANIDPILERLGTTIHASHAYLFEQHQASTGERLNSLRYEWTAPGQVSDLADGGFQNNHLIEDGFENYFNTLRKENSFIGSASTFLPKEKIHFANLGIQAILEVPLFVNGQWWGTIGFDDHENKREWSNAEVDALKIAAGILSAAIQRQKADAAVQESERVYRQAIEAAGAVPYYREYKIDRYQFMGQGFQRLTGYAPEEMRESFWNSIIQEYKLIGDLAAFDLKEAGRRVRNGEFNYWKCDYRILTRNGQIKWIADSSIELFDANGKSYASIGIMQDITERKHIEASLRKRESILEAITFSAEQFLKAPDWREKINVVLERLGKEFTASHSYLFEKHAGSNGEILNSMRHEWTAPGQRPDIQNPKYQNEPLNETGFERFYRILERGEALVGSASFLTESEKTQMDLSGIKALLEMRIIVDGKQWGTIGFDDMVNKREWTSMEVDVIKIASNVLGAAIKRQMDHEALKNELTERKRAEQALRLSEEKFSKAFHTTQVLMTIEDEKNIFIDANRAFMDAFGVERNNIIGHNASELNIFYDPADVYLLRQVFQEKGFLKDFELRFRRNSKEMGTILLSSEKLNIDNAEYTLTSGLDITDRKLVEAERERLIGELEAKNEELERFTYTVSHDLKSPLVTINGFLGYLEQDAASGNMERLKKDTHRIRDAVNKMQRLLNELLELSRIGRMMNAPETFSFEELVGEALDIVHGQFEERKITIQTQPNLPAVYGDKPRLIEVLQNILDNAAKYMGNQNNPQIEIGYEGDEKDKSIFYIKDNGIGIAPEYHERVFGLFNKLDAKTEGTGVGLALVKRIIEVHGGRIWVESQIGQGSTFYFTLPKSPESKSAGVY